VTHTSAPSGVTEQTGEPQIAERVTDLIGGTPLVRLHSVVPDTGARVVAKLEYLNPGGSVKDRIAAGMIDAAEDEGLLAPGGTIVEPTSGNTGVGLALIAQQRGYKCVFVCPDKVSADKIAVLRAFGAEVVVCPTAVPPEDPRSYYSVSDQLARDIPGAWKPNQYGNPHNPQAHYLQTGPEIWEQTAGQVTHFVAGVGTGGTISGVGRYLKEVSQGRVKVIGADPEGSVYSGGTGRPYLVEGVGEDFWPTTYDTSICDEIIAVSDRNAFDITRRLAREEGILAGGSAGLAVAAAAEVAAGGRPGDLIVVLLPDSGRGYLSKVFNDEWLSAYGFLPQPGTHRTAADILGARNGDLPAFIHLHPNETIRDAIDLFDEFEVSQIPVVTSEPPVLISEMVGAVSERHLLEQLFRNEAHPADAIAKHMGDPLPTVGSGEPVAAVVESLSDTDAVVVLSEGRPIGVLTRQDLLHDLTNFAGDRPTS
jgi:cystathionine beta-synthase